MPAASVSSINATYGLFFSGPSGNTSFYRCKIGSVQLVNLAIPNLEFVAEQGKDAALGKDRPGIAVPVDT